MRKIRVQMKFMWKRILVSLTSVHSWDETLLVNEWTNIISSHRSSLWFNGIHDLIAFTPHTWGPLNIIRLFRSDNISVEWIQKQGRLLLLNKRFTFNVSNRKLSHRSTSLRMWWNRCVNWFVPQTMIFTSKRWMVCRIGSMNSTDRNIYFDKVYDY